MTATLKQLENQKGEAQKRLDDLKAQVSKIGFSLNMYRFIFLKKTFYKKCTFSNTKILPTNLKQEDVDKSVLELYEELNEAKDKVCE